MERVQLKMDPQTGRSRLVSVSIKMRILKDRDLHKDPLYFFGNTRIYTDVSISLPFPFQRFEKPLSIRHSFLFFYIFSSYFFFSLHFIFISVRGFAFVLFKDVDSLEAASREEHSIKVSKIVFQSPKHSFST